MASKSAVVASAVAGQLIEAKPIIGPPAFAAAAYSILYYSTGMDGAPVRVSGLAIIPAAPAARGGRAVVAWAHPTTGVVERCAPSRARIRFQMISGLRTLLQHGYVVVATDYPGLGTDEPHPYLVGDSEARAVIDSVRAVRAVPDADASTRYFVWGHSQGGQAALFTGMLSRDYAPELTLMGVAAAAPATDLSALMQADMNTFGGRNITAMTLWSWSKVYGAPIAQVIDPAARPAVDRLMQECIESIYDIELRKRTASPLARSFLTDPDFARSEPWASLLAKNTPGLLPRGLPVFLAQGSNDQIVRPEITRAYVRKLCTAGSVVAFDNLVGVGHGFVAAKASLAVAAWMAARLAGEPPPNDCTRL